MRLAQQIRTHLAVLGIILTGALTAPAMAQSEKTILVLDASGSMWGQIEGEAKITIAKRVIGDLLDTLPAEQALGLSAYGHRHKGDCSDIELLVPPATSTRDDIRAAVEAINPKGKTPLSASVIAAAEGLKYEEDPATVILISDGRETCDLDPCAVGSELEAAGIGFTTHVIGFDIQEAADREQLACLAENTGGRFLSASNATELTQALEQIAEAPSLVNARFVATEGVDGEMIDEPLVWTITPKDGEAQTQTGAEAGGSFVAGDYLVEVLRPETEDTARLDVAIAADGANRFTLVLPEGKPKASLKSPKSAVAGATIQVAWIGPDDKNDYIDVALVGARGGQYVNYTYTREGSTVEVQMPPEPGDYQIRYIRSDGREVLAAKPITITPVGASLTAAETAVIGDLLSVEWTGPDYKNDYIDVASVGAKSGQYVNYTYTREGSALEVEMPPEPGEYEIRYVMHQDRTVIARKRVTVEAAKVSLEAPDAATIGSTITVEWIGPDAKNDYIDVALVGAKGNQYINYTYTREGSPLTLEVPGEPGDYEIRYVLNQDRTVLASKPLSVGEAKVLLDAPSSAMAGETITLDWIGPDAKNDYIDVALVGAKGNQYINYTYTRDGTPLQLEMPSEPGDYEIRYVLSQDRTVLATSAITVSAAEAALEAAETAVAGQDLVVTWTGPDYNNDYISVALTGSEDNTYINYTYTRDGSPLTLEMPTEPGDYEIRYVMNQDRKVIARRAVSIGAVNAGLTIPQTAPAGSVLLVEWTGPDYDNDYISVAPVGADDNDYIKYTYTRDGSPLRLQLPTRTGDFEIRYVLNQDRRVIARQTISLTGVKARLGAPEQASVGETIVVEWKGPDYTNDYVSIARPGSEDNEYIFYTYTRDGSPLRLEMPGEAGAYELRYVVGSDRTVIARAPITLASVEATLNVKDSTTPGSNLVVEWTGPDYDRDRIVLALRGSADNDAESYVYTREGSPMILKVPDRAGEFEVRYLLGRTNTVIARAPLSVK